MCFALGASALYTEPGDPFAPVVRVAPAVIITVTITAALFLGLIALVAVRTRRMDAPGGLVGPRGRVRDARRRPHARSRRSARSTPAARNGRPGPRTTGRSTAARPSRVVAVDGLTVLVEPDPSPSTPDAQTERRSPWKSSILARDRRVHRRRPAVDPVPLGPGRPAVREDGRLPARADRTRRLVREPGLRFLIPIIDRPVKVDIREQFIEVPSQTTITKDNAPINVDFLIYWRISDPLKSVVNVANFPGALQGVATTTLRAVIGDILLDEVLSKREQINEVLRVKLDEVTERWGGKVTTVEIREITPPRDVQDAMNRQLSAERTRRAVITESEGNRQAAINVAEGQKQSEILKAEGERQAAILRAEGFSQALTRIFDAASGVDEKTMALQYLEALKALGASPSTKFVIPTEFTRWIEPLAGYIEKGIAKPAG